MPGDYALLRAKPAGQHAFPPEAENPSTIFEQGGLAF
jgi:hypothetical protein